MGNRFGGRYSQFLPAPKFALPFYLVGDGSLEPLIVQLLVGRFHGGQEFGEQALGSLITLCGVHRE